MDLMTVWTLNYTDSEMSDQSLTYFKCIYIQTHQKMLLLVYISISKTC